MVSNESMQNLAENGGEMGETVQYMKRVAEKGGDFNGNASYTDLWLKMTMKATVETFGNDRITRIEMWNQETKQWISFLLNDGANLREEAEVWRPSGYGEQESKEESGVKIDGVKSTTTVVEEDMPTPTTLDDAGRLGEQKMPEEKTAVEAMSYERLAKAVDMQKAADNADKSEADDVEIEDKRVQRIHYNGNGGVQAAWRRAENMFQHNLMCLVDSVVECLVPRKDRKPAKEFLVDLSNKWFESLGSVLQTSECVSAANGWEDCFEAYKDVYLELAEGVGPFKQKYLEDDSGLSLTYKKMVGWMGKGFYITCTEMSSMSHEFADAEENDGWKSWESSDEYIEVLTLRRAGGFR